MQDTDQNKIDFIWHDCWVIMGIFRSVDGGGEINLPIIIGAWDMMNDAIYTEQELKDGFYKAQKKGLISISESHLKMTPLGSQIIEKLRTMRGGRYSIVDNLFKILTSKKIVFGEIDEKDIDPCLFINPIAIQEAYLKYAEMLKR